MSKKDKPTQKTAVPVEPAKVVKTGVEKSPQVPAQIAHPRKPKIVPGRFGVTEICNDPDKADD